MKFSKKTVGKASDFREQKTRIIQDVSSLSYQIIIENIHSTTRHSSAPIDEASIKNMVYTITQKFIMSELDAMSPERIVVIADTPSHLGKKRKWVSQMVSHLLGEKK